MKMKQIITMKLHMHNERSRSKAMTIATQADGTITCVTIKGPERDRLVIIGEDIDSVKLAQSLRKKFHEASIESVRPVLEGQNYDDNDYNYNYNYNYGDHHAIMSAPSYQYWRTLPNYEHYSDIPQSQFHNTHFNYEVVPVYEPSPPSCNIM